MPPPLFHTSTPTDNGLPLSAGALMVPALPRGKEARFTRSTLGFGHSGASNLAFVACLWLKLNGCARHPGLRLAREAVRQSGSKSVQLRHHDSMDAIQLSRPAWWASKKKSFSFSDSQSTLQRTK